ncbi:MAG: O-antigen ligase family protein [Alphaproteobacteria bacterium]|nr:O-antigen ligase family protein [Alphaproteobacteria bacterium]
MTRAVALYEAGVWRAMLVLTALFVGAGGLGVSTSAGLIGLLLLPVLALPAARALFAAPLAPALLAAALAWSALSLVWSPYDKPDQALKLILLTPLYILAVFAAAQASSEAARSRINWLIGLMLIVAVYVLVEALFNAPVALWVKGLLDEPGQAIDLHARTMIVLGRATTGFLIIAGPAAIALLTRDGLGARAGAALLLVGALAGGVAFGIEANVFALTAAAAAAALAWRFGERALGALCFAAAASIAAAPLYVGALIALVPDELAASLPLSWHMRLEIWTYALEQIAASPLIGNGLDSARVLGEDAVLRGEPFNTLPLHAHNAGLHIWLEAGFVGAALFAAALAALGWRCMRASLFPAQAAGAAFAGTAFLATVLVGSGVWQEWLHGCLAAGLATALMIRR